ncbi:hypothetical protein AKO1_012146 [Acrasis kona]|uniref:Little elongation complex subunit 2 C-terminal domain-containing protein n=1 Tax=Acrasis kona TaxID=1008807 RepID=A0AAW2ZCL9_9EUKA
MNCASMMNSFVVDRPERLSPGLMMFSSLEEEKLIQQHRTLTHHSNPLDNYIASLSGLKSNIVSGEFVNFLNVKHASFAEEEQERRLNMKDSFLDYQTFDDDFAQQLKKIKADENIMDKLRSYGRVVVPQQSKEDGMNDHNQNETSKTPSNRTSSLNSGEQKEFLESCALNSRNALPKNKKVRFIELKLKAEKEISEYQKHIFNEAMLHPECYKYISDQVKMFTSTLIKRKRDRVLTFTRFYSKVCSVNMSAVPSTETRLECLAVVKKMGSCHVLTPPTTSINMNNVYPLQIKMNETLLTPSKVELAQDLYVQDPTRPHDPIVMTSSALTCLLEHLSNKWSCHLPVSFHSREGQNSFVVIGKPFLKKRYTMRKLNEMYYKRCCTESMKSSEQCIKYSQQEQVAQDNVVYSRHKVGGLTFLLRCTHRGCSVGGMKPQIVCIKSNMEYHTDKALEVLTESDEIACFAHLSARPIDSCLMLSRVDPLRDSIVEIEFKRSVALVPQNNCLEKLHALLQNILLLPQADYLLVCEDGMINIMKAQDKQSSESLDLHEELKGLEDLTTIPYVPYWSAVGQHHVKFTFPPPQSKKKKRNRRRKEIKS